MIIVLVGHTGAGKSTIANRISERYNAEMISFASVGKKFSGKMGYNRIRECFFSLGENVFKSSFMDFFQEVIVNKSQKNNMLVIDGLYVDSIAEKLKIEYKAMFIYINTTEKICLSRVSVRQQIENDKVLEEYKLKENIKEFLGNKKVIQMADFVIDGTQDIDEVYYNVESIITKYYCR